MLVLFVKRQHSEFKIIINQNIDVKWLFFLIQFHYSDKWKIIENIGISYSMQYLWCKVNKLNLNDVFSYFIGENLKIFLKFYFVFFKALLLLLWIMFKLQT